MASRCVSRIRPTFSLGTTKKMSVRRCLFGEPDRAEAQRDLNRLFTDMQVQNSQRWNFDFTTGKPLVGRYQWENTAKGETRKLTDIQQEVEYTPESSPKEYNSEERLLSTPTKEYAMNTDESTPKSSRKSFLQRQIPDYFSMKKKSTSHQKSIKRLNTSTRIHSFTSKKQ